MNGAVFLFETGAEFLIGPNHAEIVWLAGRSYRLRHQSALEGKEVDDSKPANAPFGSEETPPHSKPANAPSGSKEGKKGGGKTQKKH